MNYSKECTVLVNSCDKYSEAWDPFFILFRKFWPDCPFQVCIATEHKHFDNNNVRTINTGGGGWTSRLNHALKCIDTPYVIFFLEDFFLQAPVNSKKLYECIKYMESDNGIGVFYFCKTEGYSIPSVEYPGFIDMNKTNQVVYHINCQSALWRKDTLLQITMIDVDPWRLEMEGYNLVNEDVKKKRFYCSETEFYDKVRDGDVFPYIVAREKGYGIYGSKWQWNNKKLFEKHGIQCEMKTLGHLSHSEYVWSQTKLYIAKSFGPLWHYIYPLYKKN